MQYQPADGNNFLGSLLAFLKKWEKVELAPYDAKDGTITLGVGYNLTGSNESNESKQSKGSASHLISQDHATSPTH